MNKVDLFNLIIDKTASICDVSSDDIRGRCRRADVVDARCMAFFTAINDMNFTYRDISSILGRNDPSAIRQLYHTYDSRCTSFCFRKLSATLRRDIKMLAE